MTHIAVIGAGVTGVSTAYELAKLGFEVTVLDKHSYPAMEVSFANCGQLSACNAEVLTNTATIFKALKWSVKKDSALVVNPLFDADKYAWLAEFLSHLRDYEQNTIKAVKLAMLSRELMLDIAKKEAIDFNMHQYGILQLYQTARDFEKAKETDRLLIMGGLQRYEVTAEEIHSIEPNLLKRFYAGYYSPNDATGDIYKYTRGLAKASEKYGVKYLLGCEITDILPAKKGVTLHYHLLNTQQQGKQQEDQILHADAIVICGGVGSHQLAQKIDDKVNIYPIKGYAITVNFRDQLNILNAPRVSLIDESKKIFLSRLGEDRLRVTGTIEVLGCNNNLPADRIHPLVDWVDDNLKITTDSVIPWAGYRPMLPDMLPLVQQGKHPRVFYNTGHGHMGFTLSSATAAIISQKISASLLAETC